MIFLNIFLLRNFKVWFSLIILLVGNINLLFLLICVLILYFFKRFVFVWNVFCIKVVMLFVLDNNFMSWWVFMFVICFIFFVFIFIFFILLNDLIFVFVVFVIKFISENIWFVIV